jgi:hypothetical protein
MSLWGTGVSRAASILFRQTDRFKHVVEERRVLKAVWQAANQPCGNLLKSIVPIWLPHYERENGRLSDGLRKRSQSVPGALNSLQGPSFSRFRTMF